MLKEEVSVVVGGGGTHTNTWSRVCDTCRSAPCAVYCRGDSAYLCSGCDARIHAPNEVASRHERVWVCEACERAPAAFLCKADAASLCATCDADIHSANPLARRHHRVPIMPVSGCLYTRPHPGFLDPEEGDGDEEEEEAASWLILNNPVAGKNNNHNNNNSNSNNNNNDYNNGLLLEGEVDGYLELFEYNSGVENQFCGEKLNGNYGEHRRREEEEEEEFSVPVKKGGGGDGVVPVQCGEGNKEFLFQNFLFGIDSDHHNKSLGYAYSAPFSQTVSISSMDVGVVPDSNMGEISLSHQRSANSTVELYSSPPIQLPTQLSAMDREARVMRYREKKKTRKFEKTIRYASRKAYAESRPRIKGRFAKRSDVESEIDQLFPNGVLSETGYGIVPSF